MTQRILIVDDAADIQHLIATSFQQHGFATLAAADGSTALELAQRERPDLILLDLGLPDIDGLDVCRQLRGESNVPIVMLTRRDELRDRIAGLKAGADDYIAKPFDMEEVLLRVQAVLRRNP